MKLQVWVNDKKVGILDRHGDGTTFVYHQNIDPCDVVSLTMPVRTASYDALFNLLPAFDVSLPEGTLCEHLRRILQKAYGRADDYDILSHTGKHQIGRVQILALDKDPKRRPSIPSLKNILEKRATEEFILEVFQEHGFTSGVSGAMPKVLISQKKDDVGELFSHLDTTQRITMQTRDYILKFDAKEYPGISLNEYHCMKVAAAAGNKTAECHLGTYGKTLAIRRSDEVNGVRCGFEDLASLNVKTSNEKYSGSIETSFFGTVKRFSGKSAKQNLKDLYRQLVTSFTLRNGDAHLKNYAVLFTDAVKGPIRLAPAYDIVTTKAYISNDMMAATLGGSKRWPKPKAVKTLAIRAGLTAGEADQIISDVAEALKAGMPEMIDDFKRFDMLDIGFQIAACRNEGIEKTLGIEPLDLRGFKPSEAAVPDDAFDICP